MSKKYIFNRHSDSPKNEEVFQLTINKINVNYTKRLAVIFYVTLTVVKNNGNVLVEMR